LNSGQKEAVKFDDVCVALITRDEETTIAKVIADVNAFLPGAEIVVVDGSSDSTPEIAAALGARVSKEPGGGAAPALLAALTFSDRPIIATIDADYTYPADALVELVERVRSVMTSPERTGSGAGRETQCHFQTGSSRLRLA